MSYMALPLSSPLNHRTVSCNVGREGRILLYSQYASIYSVYYC